MRLLATYFETCLQLLRLNDTSAGMHFAAAQTRRLAEIGNAAAAALELETELSESEELKLGCLSNSFGCS